MNLKQLEYFLQSAESKNMTEAARKLHMAQPPLSRQIQLLEEDLEVTLFKRSNRGMELTEAGEVLYEKAKMLFANVRELKEVVSETQAGVRGNINIAACFSTLPKIMGYIALFRQRFPNVTFSISQGTLESIADELRYGKIDMLFLRNCTIDSQEFRYQILEEDNFQLILHEDLDPLPGSPSVPVSYLRDLPLCLLHEDKFPGHQAYLKNVCHKHGFSPNIVCECYDTSVAMLMALRKIGAVFQAESVMETYTHPSLRVKKVDEVHVQSHITLIWNPNVHLSRSSLRFLAMFNGDEAYLD